jgi:PAS domain S-box-containing protein
MIESNGATDTPEMVVRRGENVEGARRWLYAAIPSAIGALFAILHVPHLFEDLEEGLPAMVTGSIIPVLLSLGLVWSGYWLWESKLKAYQLRRICLWFSGGILALAGIGTVSLLYEVFEDATLSHPEFLVLNFATVGGLAGILVGWHETQNRRQTEQLRIFQKVVEHGGHSICITDPEGKIEYVNPEFERQSGYDRQEVIGRNPRILNSGKHDEAFYRDMWETILEGDVWRGEIVNEQKNGTQYWIDQTITPVIDREDNIEHFVSINKDITERKEYEQELEHQNERLDEFASVVSHDLRNPLNVATGRIALAQDEYDNEHIDAARGALDRMERLIEDMLSLARHGETISESKPVSLESVSNMAWEQVEAGDGDLSVRTDRTILADTGRIQQMLENLFRNSVEHSEESVTVRVGACDGGFYVEDTGPGLPEAEDGALFESGYSTNDEGTGLGLAIVQRIAGAHGWEIRATNGSDGGARFEITGVEWASQDAPEEKTTVT